MIKELDSTVRDTSNHYLTLFVFHFTIIVQLYFDAAQFHYKMLCEHAEAM